MTWKLAFEAVQGFIETGGDVLLVIFGVTAVLWTLIIERLIYMRFLHRRSLKGVLARWEKREDHDSWYARQIRRRIISEASEKIRASLSMVKTLVAVCPLLGLLGTVTGMIEVFDVMAVAGNSNPRAMASGVSMATIPTMAGMVAALSGVYMSSQLKSYADAEMRRVGELLTG